MANRYPNRQADIYITPCGHTVISEQYFDKYLDLWLKPITNRPPKPCAVVESDFNMDITKNGPLCKEFYDNKKEVRMEEVFRKLLSMK